MGVVVQFQRWRRQTRAWTRPRPGFKAGRLLLPAVILAGAVIGYFSYGMGEMRLGWGGAFSRCLVAGQPHCVIDGDTIRYDGMTIRLADIDAPEIRDFKCPSELALGQRATRRLLELMNAGPFTVVETGRRDVDVYGRKLRLIMRDGRSLGDMLIAEGLARRWDGARRGWCG